MKQNLYRSIPVWLFLPALLLLVSCTDVPTGQPEEQPEEIITTQKPTTVDVPQQILSDIEINLEPKPTIEIQEIAETIVPNFDQEINSELLSVEVQNSDPDINSTLLETDLANQEESSNPNSPEVVEVRSVPLPERPVDEFGRTMSDEQDFAAVTSRESIESDAIRIAKNREKLIIHDSIAFDITASQENMINYALNTKHAPGTVVHDREIFFFNREKYLERCNQFVDSDEAQQFFLNNGGPKEDSANLDPDGDGFACSWNPERYRQLTQP